MENKYKIFQYNYMKLETITKKQWNETHKDYKSIINGQKFILKNVSGVTVLTPINVSNQ